MLTVVVSCKNEKANEKIPGIVLENMDKSVKQQTISLDIQMVLGLIKLKFPADRTSWGGFGELRKKTDADVLAILNKAIEEGNFPRIKDA